MGMEKSIEAVHNMMEKRKKAVMEMLQAMEKKENARSKPKGVE